MRVLIPTLSTLDFGRTGVRRPDLSPDGLVDLGDFSAFGRHYGETCS